MRFGKLPAKRDPRTLRFASLLRRAKLPAIPSTLTDPPGISTPMFANDRLGDCVIATRAHTTLRFERREQGLIVPIRDEEVEWEYLNETGGEDRGLWLLDSLRCWRKWGWTAGGRQYKCHAFAAVDPCSTDQVMAAAFLLGPLQGGFQLPFAVTRDMDNPEPWTIVAGPESSADPDAGHAMPLVGYDQEGVTLVTWGRRQRASWAWVEAYCEELFGVVDERDAWLGEQSPLDVELLESYLAQVAK